MSDPMTDADLDRIERHAESFKRLGKRSGEWTSAEESFCGPDGGLHDLIAEVRRLRAKLDEAQLRSIEARNPGIDMERVRRERALIRGDDRE